jgi:hypothetical protein
MPEHFFCDERLARKQLTNTIVLYIIVSLCSFDYRFDIYNCYPCQAMAK